MFLSLGRLENVCRSQVATRVPWRHRLLPQFVQKYRGAVSCDRDYISKYRPTLIQPAACHDDPDFMYDMYTCANLPTNMCRDTVSTSCPVTCRSCDQRSSTSAGNQVSTYGWSAQVQQLNVVMPPEMTHSRFDEAQRSRGNG